MTVTEHLNDTPSATEASWISITTLRAINHREGICNKRFKREPEKAVLDCSIPVFTRKNSCLYH